MNAIEIRGVTKQFGSVTAVNDLTLDVPEGAIYGFIGPNGSGKIVSARDEVGYLPEGDRRFSSWSLIATSSS